MSEKSRNQLSAHHASKTLQLSQLIFEKVNKSPKQRRKTLVSHSIIRKKRQQKGTLVRRHETAVPK